jgi:ribosomal protein S18 acetylase RimI-like enzyme
VTRYRIARASPRSTEQLVAAGGYGYAHSCVTSDNFPACAKAMGPAEIVLIGFDGAVTAAEALAEAARRGLARPTYEDALHFGAEHPEAQRAHPIVFLHEPWVGYFGRRDVLSLWSNAGRRELGLEGFDDRFAPDCRFAFVAPASDAVTVARADIHSPGARALIEALNAELLSRYPEPGTPDHFELDADEVALGRGAFLIASRAGEPVGCGAVRRIEPGTGEIKRMYVSLAGRGLGVGRAVLAALEVEARALGLERLVLETGVRQPEALALYERAGFSRIGRFGDYEDHALSIFMGKALRAR